MGLFDLFGREPKTKSPAMDEELSFITERDTTAKPPVSVFAPTKYSEGAVVKNSIIMQDTYIGDNSVIESVIADKKVIVKPNKKLCGASNYPVYIGKGIVI